MNINFPTTIGIILLVWMIYFALGAFANMTENVLLLKIFKTFKYIGIIIVIVVIFFSVYYKFQCI